MKRLTLLTIIVVISLLLLPGCEKENSETKGPKIETLSAEKGQLFVVSLMGRVSGLEGVALDFECGIEYSTDASFPDDKTIRQKVDKKYSEEPFNITLTRVSAGQKYYYRAYYISQLMLYYGEVKEFTFTWDAPQVSTISAKWIDFNEAKLYGSIEGLEDILKYYPKSNLYYGIQYSTSNSFGANSYTCFANRNNSQSGDTIEYSLPYFRYNTKYYYRAFFYLEFTNGGVQFIYDGSTLLDGKRDVYYGDVKDFTFTWDTAKVTTLSAELSEMYGEKVILCKGLMNGLGDIVKHYSDTALHYGIQYSTSESFDANTTQTSERYPYYNNQMGDTIVRIIFCNPDEYSGEVFKYNTEYYYRAFFNYRGIFEVGETKQFRFNIKENESEDEHQYIDLGLSVKWATCNVGATKPEQYGDYFAWGETEPNTDYNWSTYKWCKGSGESMTKYCSQSDYGDEGFTDTLKVLTLDDDVAHIKWGGSWRMPSHAEQVELIQNCTWKWKSVNGVQGYLVTSNKAGFTDRSIFLPAAGYYMNGELSNANKQGYYWSNTLSTISLAYRLYFYSYSVDDYYGSMRYIGQSIRPVCP